MIERLSRHAQRVRRVALLAVGLAELPLGFKRIEGRVEFLAAVTRLDFIALGFVRLPVLFLHVGGVRQHGPRGLKADCRHGFAEQRPVLCLVDRLRLGADHLDIIALEHAHPTQRERGIESRLAAHRRQQGVGPLLGDDLGNHFRCNRLHIGGVRQTRIGHDCRRIRIDQDDPVTFLLERLAGLSAGVVEFARLADNDRPRTDDQDRLDIITFWHSGSSGRRASPHARNSGISCSVHIRVRAAL